MITSIACSIWIAAHLPEDLWPYSVEHAVYLLKIRPVRRLGWKTPYEVINGKKPNIGNLKVFGCKAYRRIDHIPRTEKLKPRAETGYLVGYEGWNIYYIWHLQRIRSRKNTVIRSRDVTFSESQFFDPSQPISMLESKLISSSKEIPFEAEPEEPEPGIIESPSANQTAEPEYDTDDDEDIYGRIDRELFRPDQNGNVSSKLSTQGESQRETPIPHENPLLTPEMTPIRSNQHGNSGGHQLPQWREPSQAGSSLHGREAAPDVNTGGAPLNFQGHVPDHVIHQHSEETDQEALESTPAIQHQEADHAAQDENRGHNTAPRATDISVDLNPDLIIEGSHNRKPSKRKMAYTAMIEEPNLLMGYHMAINAGILMKDQIGLPPTSIEDLPLEPHTWREMQ